MNPLQRLYKTKLALLATVVTVVGIAFLAFARWSAGQPGWSWLANLPVVDVGSALFTTGLIVIFFEYVGQVDEEERASQRLRKVLAETAPEIRDSVIQGFAFTPDTLSKVASPETLDRVARNCLAIRFGDEPLAHDVYADLSEQLIQTRERRYDVSASVALSPWDQGPTSGKGAMYIATVRWEYRVVPVSPVLRFSCLSDLDEYDDVRRDPTSTATWYFQPVNKLDGASPEAFRLLDVTVDGEPLRTRRTTRAGGQAYTATIDSEVLSEGREVVVAYTYRVLVQQNSHLLHLDISRPTKGLRIKFWYGDCDIRYVNVLDYIASAKPARLSQTPANEPTPSVELGFDGWVFPKAGVAFVWVLENELTNKG